ncbi:MAG: cyclic nucleotide-binding domain-containing protein [Ardenticatenaceae bacterium]|nr:cyclic nucleotide-binding domain-containing protein [Anaerolineales bacterium]MCB8938963.1 cyclic nucleotide-binding domain-containing protein [Ardenticatenaceae bacterium]MCB8974719.1 cyclic nucleotide-binding domain-containing protein [Ardenticatenaceae bacterium]
MTQLALKTDVATLNLLQTAFPDLSRNNIETLSRAAVYEEYPAFTDICQEGEIGTTLYILDQGQVDIIVHADDNQEILVDSIGPGNYFGEMAFLGETTRMATIRTRTSSRLLSIEEEDFMAIAQANPSLLRTLLRQIIGHIRRTDRAVIHELNVKNATLRKTYVELEEQEALRTQFIATLSHELRTPLTSIKGYLGLINRGAMQGDSLQVALDSITRNVNKMVGHTNDLLILYEMHPKKPSFEYLEVADVLIEALNAARSVLNDHSTPVTIDIKPDAPKVYADRRGLTLALRALIENALKYSPMDAPVALRVSYLEKDEVAISVEDQGIGIAAADQQRLFEPFFRLEKEESAPTLYPGLGIGLTIAKFVMDRHNGRIQIQSAVGQGSTFSLCLPKK